MKRNQSPTERINEYIANGSPLNQCFAVDAMTKQAQEIVANEAALLDQMKGSFIHGPAWVAAAKGWLRTQEKEVMCCDDCQASAGAGRGRLRVVQVESETTLLCGPCAEQEEAEAAERF